ncbi:MAG: PAS domain S-box protein [Rhodoferax sp.]|nr:PAS domain S-box protein [Rhodoferax sp.]
MASLLQTALSRLSREAASLRTALILTVLAGTCIPAGITVYLERLRLTQQFEQQMQADLIDTSELFARGVKDAVWQMSVDDTQAIIAAAFADKRIVSIDIVDNAGKPFASKRRDGTAPRLTQSHSSSMQEGGKLVGTVTVTMDGEGHVRQLDAALAQNLRLVFQPLLGSLVLIGLLMQLRLIRPIRRLVAASNALAKGQLTEPIASGRRDEIGQLARSLETTRQALASLFGKLGADSSIKSQVVDVSAELQRAESLDQFAQSFLLQMAARLGTGYAVFYVLDPVAGQLQAAAGHGVRSDTLPPVALGQGLVGQCAKDQRRLVLQDSADSAIQIEWGEGSMAPKTVLLVPLPGSDALLGVLVLATLQTLGEEQQALLDAMLPMLATHLEVLNRNLDTRRQAEVLRQTEAWYRGVIESAPDGMLVADQAGSMILVNPQLERMFGYAPGALVGQNIEVLVPAAVRGHHPALRENYARGNTARNMGAMNRELRGVRLDGSEFPVDVGLSHLPALGGRGQCVCATVRDITGRLAAEVAMRESENRLSMAMRGANLGLWDWQADPDVLVTNAIWSEMLGYRSEELDALYGNTAARWANMVWPEDMDRAVGAFVRYVNNEIPEHRLEMRMKTKSGEPKWVLAVGAAVARDASGKVTRMVGIHQDITERKVQEQAMQTVNAEQSAMFEATTLGIAFIKNRVIVRSNGKLDTLFGVAEGTYIGQSTRSWYVDEAGYQLGGDSAYAELAQGKMHQREQELVRADGTRFWCHLSGAAFDPGDLGKGTVWMLEDITERKNAERAMAEQRTAMQNILDNSPVCTAFTTGGRYRYTNPEFERTFGLRTGDEAIRMFSSPADRQAMLAVLEKDGFLRDHEMRLVARDGELRDFLSTFIPFMHEGQQGVMGWLIDITERKAMQDRFERAAHAPGGTAPGTALPSHKD